MKKQVVGLMLAVSMLGLAACQPKKADPAASTTAESSAEQTTIAKTEETKALETDREVIFAASRDQAPGEEDAHYCSMSLGVWQPLITKDEKGAPKAALAESWEKNEDATVWTFKLRQDVAFHNGTPLTADIVKQNFDRYAKGPFSSSFYGINIENTYPNLTEVAVADEHTVKLTFSESVPLLDYAMANYGSSIFEPSCFGEDGNFNGLPIGTGPYKLVENVVGEYCVVERNEDYYGEPAKTNTLRFKVIKDANTRYSALMAGEMDALCDLGAITPALAHELEGNPDFTVTTGDSGITHFLNVNGNRFPFNDERMREGLSLLLDRDEINKEFYYGYAIPAGGFLNYTSPFYHKMDVKHDVERGRELIKEVVGDQDITLEFLLPTVDANRYPYEEEAVYIQAVLEELGIKSNITLLEWGTCKEMMAAGDYDMCLKIQGLSSADPYSLFKGFMSTTGGTNKSYGLGYSNAHADELIESVATELDLEKRMEIYNELQEISVTDYPNIALLYAQEVAACSSKLEGYQATPYGLEVYTKVRWAE